MFPNDPCGGRRRLLPLVAAEEKCSVCLPRRVTPVRNLVVADLHMPALFPPRVMRSGELERAHQNILVPLLRGMRLHQWTKNLLMFVPLVLALEQCTFQMAAEFTLGFMLFGLLVSGTYLVNDLIDLEADRRHPIKASRPFASGALPVSFGGAAAAAFIGVGICGGFLLNSYFGVACMAYLAITLAYSFRLKRMPLIDVLTIALLFTMRIVAGAALMNGATSHWLLNFSGFFFASLAFIKRDIELVMVANEGRRKPAGRNYRITDRPILVAFGVGLGIASLVVLALFIAAVLEARHTQYSRPQLLWLAHALITYWMLRLWLKCHRGQIADDPVVYAMRDPASIAVIVLLGTTAVLAQIL